jgi:hypothetical protein
MFRSQSCIGADDASGADDGQVVLHNSTMVSSPVAVWGRNVADMGAKTRHFCASSICRQTGNFLIPARYPCL